MSHTLTDAEAPPESHLRILEVVRRIPSGCVSTYGAVAEAAGLPRRARLVGYVLRTSPLADAVPWHRVVNASGHISERGGPGMERQRRRLEAEGTVPDESGRIDLTTYLWRPGRDERDPDEG